MFPKQFIQISTVIALMVISITGFAQNKVVVIPLGGGGIDINQCEVTRSCITLDNEITSTLTCPSGEVVIPCGFPPQPEGKDVFVTSSIHQGDLGGLEGADAICNTRAAEVGLIGGYKAWLSSTATSVASRFTQSTTPYVNRVGAPIASSFATLTSNEAISSLINITEAGVQITANFNVWTNTRANGSASETGSLNADFVCENWTSSQASIFTSEVGRTGSAQSITSNWTRDTSTDCNQFARLYCFQQ